MKFNQHKGFKIEAFFYSNPFIFASQNLAFNN